MRTGDAGDRVEGVIALDTDASPPERFAVTSRIKLGGSEDDDRVSSTL